MPLQFEQSVIVPHDYQETAVDALFDWWPANLGKYPLLVFPPGAGKTIMASMIMKRLLNGYQGISILFLAHRKELIAQTEEKLLAVWPQAPVGVYAAGLNRREIAPITIASRDTLAPALDLIPNYRPPVIMVDEAHLISHKEGTRYRNMLEEFEQRNSNLMAMGLTATPYRSNHGYIYGPDEVFHGVAYEMTMRQLLDMKRLVPLTTKSVSVDAQVNTDGIPLVNGDFNQKKLSEVSINHRLIDAQIDEWIRLAVQTGRKHNLFFCVSIAHAEAVQQALAIRGFEAPLLTGKTPQDNRSQMIDHFGHYTGQLKLLINIGTLTEGTDIPAIDCIVMLRAVHSLNLIIQILGRGMRTFEEIGKTDCLLVDFGGNVDRFGPIDIAQPPERRGKPQKRTKECPECSEVVNFYQRKCLCGHEFSPPPHKVCPKCSTENAPSAGKCISCGHIFADGSEFASSGQILSNGEKYRRFQITRPLYVRSLISKASGKGYLQVVFQNSYSRIFTKNLMIGYEGFAGAKASREWDYLTVNGTPLPDDVEHACRLADESPVFRAVSTISVDMASKYKDIKSIEFDELNDE